MKSVRIGLLAGCLVIGASGGAAAQSSRDVPWGAPRTGQTPVPGGMLQWRFIETPRFAAPPVGRGLGGYGAQRRGYGYPESYPRYGGPRRSYSYGANRYRPAPGAADPTLGYRFDERRGVWVAERPVGL